MRLISLSQSQWWWSLLCGSGRQITLRSDTYKTSRSTTGAHADIVGPAVKASQPTVQRAQQQQWSGMCIVVRRPQVVKGTSVGDHLPLKDHHVFCLPCILPAFPAACLAAAALLSSKAFSSSRFLKADATFLTPRWESEGVQGSTVV